MSPRHANPFRTADAPSTGPAAHRRTSAPAGPAVAAAAAIALLLLGAGCASSPPPSKTQPAVEAGGGTRDVPPEALVGNWLFEIKMGSQTIEGSLHFVITKGVLTGTWTSAEGNEYELKDIKISGNQVTWNGDGPRGVSAATGTIDGTSMKGTMKRAARRGASGGSSGSSGDSDNPPGDGSGSGSSGSSGGGGRRGGRMGGGRRGGSGGSGGGITWTAFKSNAGSEKPGTPPG